MKRYLVRGDVIHALDDVDLALVGPIRLGGLPGGRPCAAALGHVLYVESGNRHVMSDIHSLRGLQRDKKWQNVHIANGKWRRTEHVTGGGIKGDSRGLTLQHAWYMSSVT